MTNKASLLNELRESLKKSLFGFLNAPIDLLVEEYGSAYTEDAELYLMVLRQAFPDKNWPQWYVNSFIRWNREILKEEKYFNANRHYSGENMDVGLVQMAVYNNQDVMEGFYLCGLYLSYFFWPHHYELKSFFQSAFIAPEDGKGLLVEWGVGHGLFSLIALKSWEAIHAKAYDISEHSIAFSKKLLSQQHNVRIEFIHADILETNMPLAHYIICGELLEHVPQPERLLEKAFQTLRVGGKMFLTGAINAPQQDHLYHFHTPEEILNSVTRCGFKTIASRLVTHPQRLQEPSPPQVLALVVQKDMEDKI